jgi:ribosomal protein L31
MDRYQQAVEYLTANPDYIGLAWAGPSAVEGGCLFRFASKSGKGSGLPIQDTCGCLTMIRSCHQEKCESATPELTALIRADERIPKKSIDITPDHLPIFAGWQRRLDQELGRTPLPLDPRLPAPTGDIEIPTIEMEAAWA